MARNRVIISSSGGIAAGSPFLLDAGLFVSQASPPVANTGRWARLADANLSLVAPGVLAGNHSFVVGESAVDTVGGDRSVLVGYNLSQNNGGAGQATDQVLIGNTIAVDATSAGCTRLIIIGSNPTFTGFAAARGYGRSIAIGADIKLRCINTPGGEAVNCVYIGSGVDGKGGGNVGIGVNALLSDAEGVAIGNAALTNLQTVAVGSNADASATKSIAVGKRARATTNAIAVGWFADAQGDGSLSIGNSTSNTGTGSIVLGNGATTGSNQVFLAGSSTYPIRNFRFGDGQGISAGGIVYTLQVSDIFTGAGNNIEGNTLQLKCGPGTGNWTNTQNRGFDLQLGIAGASGSTQQVSTSVIAARHADLNISFWGGLGATFQGGAKAMFIGNCTTAPVGAPTNGVLLYAVAGQLFGIGAAGIATLVVP